MSNFSTNLVRFVLKLANVLLLLLGISMGLYALSTFEEYKKLKHGDDGNATLVEFPHLDIPLGHSHLDFNLSLLCMHRGGKQGKSQGKTKYTRVVKSGGGRTG